MGRDDDEGGCKLRGRLRWWLGEEVAVGGGSGGECGRMQGWIWKFWR